MVTVEQLIKLGASPANANKYVKPINDTCIKYQINTEARISAFLAQIFEESGALTNIKENLNYSAARLMAVWPTRFPTLASAIPYAMKPTVLAEKVYGGRGLNPPNRAFAYIGRGMIQITFLQNYKNCGDALGLDLVNHPELLESPEYAVMSAGWFWNEAHCNALADGDNLEAVKAVTKKVNGGYGNLKIRQDYWLKAKKLGFNLVSDTKPLPVPTQAITPLPNVVLATEKPEEVMQHNPVEHKGFLDFILGIFKKV